MLVTNREELGQVLSVGISRKGLVSGYRKTGGGKR